MDTIRERVEAFFAPQIFMRLAKVRYGHAQDEVKAFLAQELELLASEVEKEVQNNNSHDWDSATLNAATLIRNRAGDLK